MRYSNLDLAAQYLEALQSEMDVSDSGDVSKSMTVKSALRLILFRLSDLYEYPEEFDCDECSSDDLQELVDEFDAECDYTTYVITSIKDDISIEKQRFRRYDVLKKYRSFDAYSLRSNHTHYYAETNYWVN